MTRTWLGPAAAFAICLPAAPAIAVEAERSVKLPVPRLVYSGSEAYEANGFDFVRYHYDVVNKSSYSRALFATSGEFPPCGKNPNPSRLAVEIFDSEDKRLVEFCSLPEPHHLGRLWFAVAKDKPPPKSIYIKITDRLTNRSVRSKAVPASKR